MCYFKREREHEVGRAMHISGLTWVARGELYKMWPIYSINTYELFKGIIKKQEEMTGLPRRHIFHRVFFMECKSCTCFPKHILFHPI